MSPTEITRISKWLQFAMTILGLLGQILSKLPNFLRFNRRKKR